MLNMMLRLFGERALHKAINAKAGRNPLDIKFGFALLRDKRVPFKSKLLSLVAGIGLLGLLLLLQIPVEVVATTLAPILLPLDFAIDGLELVALPILFMAVLLAYIAPRTLVDAIHAERLLGKSANDNSNVIDVESYAPQTMTASQPTLAAPIPPQVVYAGSRRS